MTPEGFRYDETPLASVKLHALGRRFERGRYYDDAAIKSDIAALAHVAEMPSDTRDFVVEVSAGVWVTTMSMSLIDNRGEPMRIAVARSYFVGGMTARFLASDAA